MGDIKMKRNAWNVRGEKTVSMFVYCANRRTLREKERERERQRGWVGGWRGRNRHTPLSSNANLVSYENWTR